MQVEFRRTGERRYAITIFRKDDPTIEMNPAPGYDRIMPHDLLHLIVEKELRLRRGIFGQLAAGGNAGTFRPVASAGVNKREASRLRRKVAKRGEKLLRVGRDESALSEHAAYVCLNEWLSRSTDPNRRKLAVRFSSENNQSTEDDDILTREMLDRVCARLDQASALWASLEIGESFSVMWPEQLSSKMLGRKLENAT
jgi:hypothetical protein